MMNVDEYKALLKQAADIIDELRPWADDALPQTKQEARNIVERIEKVLQDD